MDREMDRQMEGWIDRSGAGQVDDGRTDRQADRQTDFNHFCLYFKCRLLPGFLNRQ